jgi:TetR/AcrR family transcriptional regulator, mexJK operon transcriptional repressor
MYRTVHFKRERQDTRGVMSEEADAVTRPRLVARRRAFLEAATAVFLKKGYANATLDDIIARSGGSRQTLYSLFGGKQGLFEALIGKLGAEIFAPFRAAGLLDRPPDEVLVEVGIRYLETLTTPDALGVYRLIVAEGVLMRELAERYWEMGPAHTRALLAGYFEQQTRRGTLRLQDPEQAADQFWGMVLGYFQQQCVLGLREAPGPEEIEAYVRSAVAWFLDGCRANNG